MNIFALSALASPLAGAIAGAVCVRTPGVLPSLGCIIFGSILGVTLYFLALGFSSLMLRVHGVCTTIQGLSPLQWLASAAGVLLPAAAPFAAGWLTCLLVTHGLIL